MSSNRSKLIWVAVGSSLLGVFATLIYLDSSQPSENLPQFSGKSEANKPPKPQWQNATNNTTEDNKAIGFRQPSDAISAQEQRIPKYPKPTLENPPASKQVREEAAADSHATPRSLIEFAEELAESMQSAYANNEVRYNVSRQLINCAKDTQAKGAAQAARALCLTNLERLKEKFPEELLPAYVALIAELPDDLLFISGINKPTEEK